MVSPLMERFRLHFYQGKYNKRGIPPEISTLFDSCFLQAGHIGSNSSFLEVVLTVPESDGEPLDPGC